MIIATSLRVTAAAAVVAVSAPAATHSRPASDLPHGRTGGPTAQACSIAVVSRRPLALIDGQIVHVAVGSIAEQARTVLLAGVPAYTWPASATAGASPQTRDSLIGLLATDEGAIRGVPNPLAGRLVSHVKVAGAGGGAWHALLTERLTTRQGHEQATDSARLWYGRFDGRDWSDIAPVTVVHGAYTAGEYTSDVVAVDGGGLAFAYPLDARVGPTAVTGVVIVRRDERRWSFDTLSGLIEPRYTRLVRPASPGAWTVVYVAPFFEHQRLVNASLHAATWDGRWSAPRVLVQASGRALLDPTPFALRAGLLLTWSRRAERTDSATAPRIEWMLASPDGMRALHPRHAVLAGSNEYTAVALGADSVMWFARDGLTPDRVRVAAFDGDSVTDVGTLRLRNETRVAAVAVPGVGVALITSELGRQPTEPPAASILTVVKPVCPSG